MFPENVKVIQMLKLHESLYEIYWRLSFSESIVITLIMKIVIGFVPLVEIND